MTARKKAGTLEPPELETMEASIKRLVQNELDAWATSNGFQDAVSEIIEEEVRDQVERELDSWAGHTHSIEIYEETQEASL